MSPFTLATGEMVSCMAYGQEYPFEHAGSCTCPCPPCVVMQRAVLEHLGVLPADTRPRRIFLHAYGELRVSDELRPDDVVETWFHGQYRAIEAAAGSREPIPTAAYGWLLAAEGHADALVRVIAPRDPSDGSAEQALSTWAAARGMELLGPLDVA